PLDHVMVHWSRWLHLALNAGRSRAAKPKRLTRPATHDSPPLGELSQLGPHPHAAESTMLMFSLISGDCWGGVAERKPAVGALTPEPRLMPGRVGLPRRRRPLIAGGSRV